MVHRMIPYNQTYNNRPNSIIIIYKKQDLSIVLIKYDYNIMPHKSRPTSTML